MNDIDEQIKQALLHDDDEFLDELGTDTSLSGMFAAVIGGFRGRLRWIWLIGFLGVTFFTVLAVVSAVQFFRVETVRAIVGYGVGFFFCFGCASWIKLWYFQIVNQHAVLREVKRVELQIAQLACRLDADRSGNDAQHDDLA